MSRSRDRREPAQGSRSSHAARAGVAAAGTSMGPSPDAAARRAYSYAAVLAAIAVLVYANTVGFDYALDDYVFITGNQFTLKGLAGIKDILTHDVLTGYYGVDKSLYAGGRYRPLALITFALEIAAFGQRPGLSHAINVLCYGATVLLLFALLRRLLPTSAREVWYRNVPFLATAFFAVHPLHTEVVAAIKGRDDILSLLFGLGALLCCLRAAETRRLAPSILGGALMLLGLMSKESAVSFLAVAPLMLWYFTRRRPGEIVAAVMPLAAGVALYLALRFVMIAPAQVTVAPELMNDPFLEAHGTQRLATIVLTWLLYLKLLVVPHPLTHDYYPYHIQLVDFSDPRVLLSLVVTAVLLAAMLRGMPRRSLLSFCIAWYGATIALYTNLLFNIGMFMNERFLYIPTVGFCLLLAWALVAYARDARVVASVAVLLLVAGATKTFARNFAWRNNVTLALTDVATSSGSARAQMAAGWAYLSLASDEADPAVKRRELEQSIEHLRISVGITDGYYPAQETMALALTESGQYDDALRFYAACFRMKPGNANVATAVEAMAQKAVGDRRLDAARQAYELLVAQAPSADVYALLGQLYGEHLHDLPNAEKYLRTAMEMAPADGAIAGNLGIVYAMGGRLDDAITMFDRSLAIDPGNARMYLNRARALRQLGRTAEADASMRRATELDPALGGR